MRFGGDCGRRFGAFSVAVVFGFDFGGAGGWAIAGFGLGLGVIFCGRISAFGSGAFGLAWQQALARAVLHAAGLAVVAVAAFLILLPFVPSLPYSAYRLASDLSLALIAPFPSPRWVVRREDRA
jgi:hypothetical protein